MACRRCGSPWCTKAGKDKASCPECCKQQRRKARVQGLLPSCCEKACKRCGETFTAKHANAMARQLYCDACKEAASAERSAERRERWNANQKTRKHTGSPRAKKKRRLSCMMCGSKLTNAQKKYCCLGCYNAAKKVGLQAWDRTKIDDAARTRPSISASPRRGQAERSGPPWMAYKWGEKSLRRCATALRSFLSKIEVARGRMDSFFRRLPSVRECPVCKKSHACRRSRKHPHCSRECFHADKTPATCMRCKKPMLVSFAGSNFEQRLLAPMCDRCLLAKARKKYGCKDFRSRCMRFGVAFDPEVKPRLVFDRDRSICHICKRKTLEVFTWVGGKPHPMSPTVDHHPYPLSAGVMGHTWDNVRCACWGCNTAKGAKWSGQLPLPLGSATGSQT